MKLELAILKTDDGLYYVIHNDVYLTKEKALRAVRRLTKGDKS